MLATSKLGSALWLWPCGVLNNRKAHTESGLGHSAALPREVVCVSVLARAYARPGGHRVSRAGPAAAEITYPGDESQWRRRTSFCRLLRIRGRRRRDARHGLGDDR